jgi:NAD(P)-dependent dehydrogenase (short-subunit alcohol dehydrogenase family)
MKIAVTGHKSGIGKAIYTLLSQTHSLQGFDLDTVNIENQEDRNNILRETNDCDIFINNAFANGSQILLFKELLEKWKHDSSKYIINIGSIMRYKTNTGSQTEDTLMFPPLYINHKKELHRSTLIASFDKDIECKLSIIQPGFTRTQFTEELDVDQMEASDVALQVKYIIESNVHIVDIAFKK